MTTTAYHGLGVRQRRAWPARQAPSLPHDSFQQMLARAEERSAQPFAGITTDGHVLPGLFPLQHTGVSTAPVLDAAKAFLAGLDEGQRSRVQFGVDAPEWRKWSNIHAFTTRHGLLLEDLAPAQRDAALAVVEESLSAGGFRLARDIMHLNGTMAEITQKWDELGEWIYFFSVFGTPSPDAPWGWQIDGHHLNLSFFVLGDQVSMAPVFMGSEPVQAETGKYEGTRVLQAEEQNGLELAQSLSPAQQAKAFRPRDPEGGGRRQSVQADAYNDNQLLPYEGVSAGEFSAGQKDLLLRLVETYVARLRPGHDRVRLEEVRRNLDDSHFLWAGGVAADSVFYYRVHSPVVLIEFDHQAGVFFDNDEPTRVHIHTIMRTPNGNDYGKDLLRQHYARFPHAAPR